LGSSNDVTTLLRQARDGDGEAAEKLCALLRTELHAQAHRLSTGHPDEETLHTTPILSEVYVSLLPGKETDWEDRKQFFETAARVLRGILVDRATHEDLEATRTAETPPQFDRIARQYQQRAGDLGALNEALLRLDEIDPDATRVVELRFFGGLDLEEVARLLGISTRRTERIWLHARAWLRREMP